LKVRFSFALTKEKQPLAISTWQLANSQKRTAETNPAKPKVCHHLGKETLMID
jgi:hypothetical protein